MPATLGRVVSDDHSAKRLHAERNVEGLELGITVEVDGVKPIELGEQPANKCGSDALTSVRGEDLEERHVR